MKDESYANLTGCSLMFMQVVAVILVRALLPHLPFLQKSHILLAFSEIVSAFLPAMLLLLYIKKTTKKTAVEILRLNALSDKNLLLIVLMSITIQPTMSALSYIGGFLFPNDVTVMLDDLGKNLSFPLMIVFVALIPAICEELALRGSILAGHKGGGNLSFTKIALLNGLFFALMHLNAQQLLYTFAIGVFFAFLVERTNSLFASIVAHFTINFTQASIASILSAIINSPNYNNAINEATANAPNVNPNGGLNIFMMIITILFALNFFLLSAFAFTLLLRQFKKSTKDRNVSFVFVRRNKDFSEKSPMFVITLIIACSIYFTYILLSITNVLQIVFIILFLIIFFFMYLLAE